MSRLLITRDSDNDYDVWIAPNDEDPVEDPLGFVLTVGKTRDEAVAAAVKDLEAALELLQAPQGTIEERDL